MLGKSSKQGGGGSIIQYIRKKPKISELNGRVGE